MYVHVDIMCNCTDVVWIGQPDVNERLVSRETPESITLVQWYGALDTLRGRRARNERRTRTRARDVSMQNVVRGVYANVLCIVSSSSRVTTLLSPNAGRRI